MGHQSIAMTLRYSHLSPAHKFQQRRDAHQQFMPWLTRRHPIRIPH